MKKARWKEWLISCSAMLVGLVIIFPIIAGLLFAFRDASEFDLYPPILIPSNILNLTNFVEIITISRVPRYMLNSLWIASVVTVVRLILAAFAAYAFAFMNFKGKNFFFFYILGTMMVPAESVLLANYLTINKLGLINTYLGVMVVFFVSANNMFMLRQNFKVISTSLREAAFLDGCGDMRFFTNICVPLSLPILTSLGISSFISVWNAYLWPLLVVNDSAKRTVQVGIKLLQSEESTNRGVLFAGVYLSLVPTALLFVFTQRSIVQGIASGAVKG